MTQLDERLSEAVNNLRDDVDLLDPPPFRPRRSAAPVAFVLILLVGIGLVGYFARSATTESGGFSVATQPESPDGALTVPVAEPDVELPTAPDSEPALVPSLEPDVELPTAPGSGPPPVPEAAPADEPLVSVFTGQVTVAEPGEFLMPLPDGAAWSNDEAFLLIYRTGDVEPGHFVVDTMTGRDVSRLPFTPADIEQVYWHPLDDNLLLYTEGADLLSYGLFDGRSTVLHSFADCDRVDSGVLPVSPADDGTVSLLCHHGIGREQVTFNLATGEELRSDTSSDTAALPSPSGDRLVRLNSDGSATVLRRDLSESGVVLTTEDNDFGFVTDAAGREWIATTLFDGPTVGSVVLLPLDGASAPVVAIGPARGDAYPPSGTRISTAGNVVALSIKGSDDGELAGRVTRIELNDSLEVIERSWIAHESGELHGYWSTPFLSLSPSGKFVIYSTDRGGDSVDSFIVDLTSIGG